MAATTTQTVSQRSAGRLSSSRLHLLQARTRSVVRDVLDGRGPDEAVPSGITASGCVGDRLDHRLRSRVLDDEDEQRLREEARLEDPAAVLVGDAPLPAVTYRLENSGAEDMGPSFSTASMTVSTRSLMTGASTLTTVPPLRTTKKPRGASPTEASSPDYAAFIDCVSLTVSAPPDGFTLARSCGACPLSGAGGWRGMRRRRRERRRRKTRTTDPSAGE